MRKTFLIAIVLGILAAALIDVSGAFAETKEKKEVPQTKTEATTKSDTKSDAKSDKKSDTKSDAKSDAKPDKKPDAKPDSKKDKKTDTKPLDSSEVDWDQYWEDYYQAEYEKFEYYEKNDYDPRMKPLDLTPVRFYVQDEHDGTYTLTMTLKNFSDRSWPAGKYELLCKRGSEYLAEGSGPRWTIEEETPRGTTTQVVATLKEYVRGGRMVFYIMDGVNSFYGFYIRL